MLDRSPVKWRQRPDMNIAVDWDAKPQIKQTNKQNTFKCDAVVSLIGHKMMSQLLLICCAICHMSVVGKYR